MTDARTIPQSVLAVLSACMTFPTSKFDRVVMNPPFSRGQDVEHVRHALSLLAPGGLLVSVMSNGVTFRQDRRYADFRRDFSPEITPLPEGSFKTSGTNVSTVVVRIRKAGP